MMVDKAEDNVILVDENDDVVGEYAKLAAHEEGKLHRAFSVFVFNRANEILLQRRADDKYHSGGLWSNTCCSHPRPGETTLAAAHRRLREEMGFDCDLEKAFGFVYKVKLNDLYEHEYDHVFVGQYEGFPSPLSSEASDWRWVPIADLNREIEVAPDSFSYWFRLALEETVQFWLDRERTIPVRNH